MPPVGQNLDFSSLSDQELSQMLKDYGVDVGPINGATRKTYERKLIKLKTGLDSPPSHQYDPVDEDDDDEDEVVQIRQPVLERTPVMSRSETSETTRMRRDIPEAYTPRMESRPTPETYSPRIESRPTLSSSRRTTVSYTPATDVQTERTERSKERTSGGIPTWVKIVGAVVILILIFLIYSNMEPTAVNQIPTITNKVEV
ncbi:lamina-associated polypeptide 2, isoforms beta/gamma-like [Physella acuta]|uniref:lamina-associated polypeptide 2, isoforms beta/gamma-like n=1 Tax=Physella acuta TaxID=109671 RepID=UPI0027DD3AF7|nr:lamina-associated polypeptide 2, isoforms beta/gamma-like [Physella acuta]